MNSWTDGTIQEKSMRPKYIDNCAYTIKSNNYKFSNEKIINRYKLSSTVSNPFLQNNNYIDDLNIQNEFLIPQNSNYTKN